MAELLAPGLRAPRRYLREPKPLYFPEREDRTVPESPLRGRLRTALFLLLDQELRDRAYVGMDQFVYWDPTEPKQCFAPDAFVHLGGPLELPKTYRTWVFGAPHVGVEIVSRSDQSARMFATKLERYRRCGVPEVVRFNPDEGAVRLRIWDLIDGDLVEREPSDAEFARCDALEAYWVTWIDPRLGPVLRLSRDREGRELWPTQVEAAELAVGQRERAEKEAALRRVAELEEELRKLRG